jgi:hypothetical protein
MGSGKCKFLVYLKNKLKSYNSYIIGGSFTGRGNMESYC